MASQTRPVSTGAPRLTFVNGVLMVVAALVVFGIAYAAGGFFGRQADDKVNETDARIVEAEEPAGTPLLTLAAWEVAFDTREVRIPADQPVHLRLDNRDAGILHNIAVYRDPRASDLVARGKLFDGPEVRDYRFDGFSPGSYYFQCDLHPAMNGTLIAE
jgi:plastocyanin